MSPGHLRQTRRHRRATLDSTPDSPTQTWWALAHVWANEIENEFGEPEEIAQTAKLTANGRGHRSFGVETRRQIQQPLVRILRNTPGTLVAFVVVKPECNGMVTPIAGARCLSDCPRVAATPHSESLCESTCTSPCDPSLPARLCNEGKLEVIQQWHGCRWDQRYLFGPAPQALYLLRAAVPLAIQTFAVRQTASLLDSERSALEHPRQLPWPYLSQRMLSDSRCHANLQSLAVPWRTAWAAWRTGSERAEEESARSAKPGNPYASTCGPFEPWRS